VGLFPWGRAAKDGFSLERLALWLMALYTLISAAIGGATGAYFGNGFSSFLAEDVLGHEHDLGQRAIIAHLHIMLTLIDIGLLLIIARVAGLKGRLQQVTMAATIIGTTVVSFATWSVMVYEEAHRIINMGSAFLLLPALVVAIYGFAQLAKGGQSLGGRFRALLGDPVRFGLFFELIFVNLVVTGPGVYVAINLETFRQPEFDQVERAIAVGHWHVLATLSALIALLLVVDRLGVKGRLRQLIGWGSLLGSTLAFVFVQFYMFRQPDQSSDWAVPFIDVGIGLFLLALAVFLAARFYRLARDESGVGVG
jgi:hypothetical protein